MHRYKWRGPYHMPRVRSCGQPIEAAVVYIQHRFGFLGTLSIVINGMTKLGVQVGVLKVVVGGVSSCQSPIGKCSAGARAIWEAAKLGLGVGVAIRHCP